MDIALNPSIFKHGGTVRGPGGIDQVPALLTAGEEVINAGASRRNRSLLRAINAGAVLKFADGGLVPSLRGLPATGGSSGSSGGSGPVIENLNLTVAMPPGGNRRQAMAFGNQVADAMAAGLEADRRHN